jgi:hypothetical protein
MSNQELEHLGIVMAVACRVRISVAVRTALGTSRARLTRSR